MGKKRIIEKLNEQLRSEPVVSVYGQGFEHGIREAIALIEGMEDEPITAAALEQVGFVVSGCCPFDREIRGEKGRLVACFYEDGKISSMHAQGKGFSMHLDYEKFKFTLDELLALKRVFSD